MFGPSGVLPRVLPFTQFYPGFTQLPRVKLGKTLQRFYPPTLMITGVQQGVQQWVIGVLVYSKVYGNEWLVCNGCAARCTAMSDWCKQVCSKTYCNAVGLRWHLRTQHLTVNDEVPMRFPCGDCGQTYGSIRYLKVVSLSSAFFSDEFTFMLI